MKYFLPTDHLITVDSDTLLDWQKNWNNRSDVGTKNKYPQYTLDFKHHALDDLYELITAKCKAVLPFLSCILGFAFAVSNEFTLSVILFELFSIT